MTRPSAHATQCKVAPVVANTCGVEELAYDDLQRVTGLDIHKVGPAVALLKELGLPEFGKPFGKMTARRRGTAHHPKRPATNKAGLRSQAYI